MPDSLRENGLYKTANNPLLDTPSITIPDDPQNVPLDGGVAVLITIVTGIGFGGGKWLVC
jgi:hypothetical protein